MISASEQTIEAPGPALEALKSELQRREADEQLLEEAETAGAQLSTFVKAGWHVLEPSTPLTWGWALDCMCEHLEAVTAGQIKRLLINVPPGMMKSLLTMVFWPCYEWGPKGLAHHKFFTASFSLEWSIRDNRRARQLMQSRWFQSRWPLQLARDQNAKKRFENEELGWRQASAFKSLTGERGDRAIVDDPLSVNEGKSDADRQTAKDNLLETLPNRVVDPKRSAIIIIGQRVHEADPSGVILEMGLDYTHLMLPMEFEADRTCYTVVKPKGFEGEARLGRYDGPKQVWYFEGDEIPDPRREFVDAAKPKMVYPHDRRTRDGELLFEERFPAEEVEAERSSLRELGFACQHQQRPAPREGGMFKRADFKIIDAEPADCRWVRGWDLAATEDDSAPRTCGVKMGRSRDRKYYIAHAVMERPGPNDVRKLLVSTAQVDTRACYISIPQDPGSAGKVQAHDLVTHLAGFRVSTSPETGDKETRAEPFAAQVEAGNVYLINGPWVQQYLDEVTMFPNGKLKDAVDASSRAFAKLLEIGVGYTGQGSIG